MIFARKSPLTGVVNQREIPVTQEQYSAFMNGTMIQDAMPNLSADDREFILTGITPEDWATIFPGEG